MIWLSWRQFRVQAFVTGAALIVVAVALLSTGLHLSSLFDSNGLATCRAGCGTDAANFANELKGSTTQLIFYGSTFLMYVVPGLIGIFWGAPLVARELESCTFRLAWNQSVTMARWIGVKLGLIGLAAIATTGLLSIMTSWWAAPLYQAGLIGGPNPNAIFSTGKIAPPLFGATGIAPVGYAAFAFALGVAAGVLIRRTIPAMAITLVIFGAVQVVMPLLIQPHLITPVQLTAPFNANTANEIMISSPGNTMTVMGNFSRPGAWILSNQTITPSGQVFTGPAASACTSSSASPQACGNWLNTLHLRQLITYQPASRYWPLQWLELAIYLVLAAALGVLCVWQVRRRRA